MSTDTLHIPAVVSAAWSINDRAAAAMHMLAAARRCLADREGMTLMFDDTDYETALAIAARRVSEQMQYRCGLNADQIAVTVEEALAMLREHYRDADDLGIYAMAVSDVYVFFACQFWNDLDTDAGTCARIAAMSVQTPTPEPMQLAPAAFAELALHAGSASGWEQLSDDHHKEVLDTDGSRGGSRWDEVQANLDLLPHEGTDLTRGAEYLTPEIVSDGDGSGDVPPVDADTASLAQQGPEGWELVLSELIDGLLYETRIPTDPTEPPTRTPIKISDHRNEASTEVLLHLLAAGSADGGRPAALAPNHDGYALMGGPRNSQRRGERLAESARLAVQAHVLLYRSGGRARASGAAAREGSEVLSTQSLAQLFMELCLAAGFAWRWVQRVVGAWDDDSARRKTITTKSHLVAQAVSDAAYGCFMNVFGDGSEELGAEVTSAIVIGICDAVDQISAGRIRRLQALYGPKAGR